MEEALLKKEEAPESRLVKLLLEKEKINRFLKHLII